MEKNNLKFYAPVEYKSSSFQNMENFWQSRLPLDKVADSLMMAKKFSIKHDKILRAIDKCRQELSICAKFKLHEHLKESNYWGGARGKERPVRKVDITEFGLAILLLYIKSPKARRISSQIMYRIFKAQSCTDGIDREQLDYLKEFFMD